MDNNYSISKYSDATTVTYELDDLIRKPIYSISKYKLADYELNYFDKKCNKSKK